MESCQKCGHIRYAGDLFDGGCSDCCDWMVAKLAELTAERDALRDSAKDYHRRAQKIAAALSKKLHDSGGPSLGRALANAGYVAERTLRETAETERDALKAKLAEAARMANGIRESVGLLWRPIETAPKDGSEILAHRHDCGVLIASWREPAEFMTDDEIESSDLPADELYSPCWFAFGSWGVSQIGDGDLFTSWMPLPEPPAILNDAREGGE